MRCCYCGGRGWTWVGVASNAEREPCGPCEGRGRWHRVNWGTVGGVVIVLFSLALFLAILHWGVSLAHGASAGSMTLDAFRKHPSEIRTALVAGAMAATEQAGLRCPAPQGTVAEYVSALQWRVLDTNKPWIAYYFMLLDQRGCQVENDQPVGIDPKEGT